jgi:esterase/lipase superfamily enzyme
VDEDALEPGEPLGRLHEIARSVSVYFNTGDAALHVSDVTKGNPDRLGTSGASRPAMLHSKIYQIDCSEVVGGLVEHGYYLAGNANRDIRLSLGGRAQDFSERDRERDPIARNTWTLRG